MVAASLLGLVCQYKLSTTTAGLWLCSVLIGEIWLRRAAISLLRAPVETQGQRINFLLAFACGTLAWSSVGVLGWNIDGGAFQGTCMVVWMTQFMLAAVYAFRSRSGYIVATAAPMAAMLVAVVPTFTHMDASKAAGLIAGVLGPLIGYAMARHADKQREVLVATLSKLEQAAQSAALGASAKSEFLANMSHELRTPLTAILGFSELLQNSKSLTPEDSRSADRINTASRTLLTVVNDILDFSKMEAGALELEAQALDPVRLMQDALDVVAACAAAKGLGLRLEVTGAPVLVVGDPIRLRQVLFNLMNNALKFTSRGEIVGAVVFTPLGEEACRLRFEVRDTGIGIAEDKRSVMFERFSQADGSITRQYGGTGLGLAICKRIVTLMKGVIDVDSQLGQGSVFWLEVEAPIADHLAADSSPALSHATDGLDVRVLVAEDHPVNQELLRIILESAGVQVHVVGDGAQAVEAFQTGGFDLILMDVQMPVMDGPEATRRIRALEGDGARLPIIAMTANVMHHQISAYLAAGMDAHLGKPVDSIALIETVADWVDRSRLRVGAGEARAA
jgi:signal transduction histidine kinase/ActR/RegA family two-component response regulator